MLDVAIMIEGQNGLNWTRWKRIAQAVEELGFNGLFRSDHFTNTLPPDLDSLELWVSLTWLASHIQRIAIGPLVTPLSFRNPIFTARMAKDVDDLSCGRLILGIGAGWLEREHENFGFELLDVPQRFDRFEEGMEVITHLLRSNDPVDFEGEFYQLRSATLLPKPARKGGPPILIGGNGPKRSLPLAAKYADEWNGVYIPAERFSQLNQHLNALIEKAGRNPNDVRRSLMTRIVFGQYQRQLDEKIKDEGHSIEEMRQAGFVIGTPVEVIDQLGLLAEVGVERVMLQWLDLDDLEGLETLAKSVLPSLPEH
jgi:F420-dependent oxidoreductase-like protein